MIIPRELLDSVTRHCAREAPEGVFVYWVSIDGDREAMHASILELRTDYPLVPIVLRETRFDDANTLANDFVALVEKNRAMIEPLVVSTSKRIIFLLLARREMGMADSSSPALLPQWLGCWGGTSPLIRFRDITWQVDASLASNHARLDGVAECLFALERATVQRLESRWISDPKAIDDVSLLLRRTTDHFDDFGGMLRHYSTARDLVTSSADFRPSIRDGEFVIARLWGIALKTAPDSLDSAGRVLGEALYKSTIEINARRYESLVAVLGRIPPQTSTDIGRLGRAYLHAVLAACQLLTAGAHADDYPMYPVQLLRSFSFDLRRSLDCFTQALSI